MKWADDLIERVPDGIKFAIIVIGALGVMVLEAVYPVAPAL